MKFEDMEKIFNEVISKNLSEDKKRQKLEPLFVKHKHYTSIFYHGFYNMRISYNITNDKFTQKILELLKNEY